ncbi:hypothetical protein MPTK1_5g08860 [Marchantia polymorpha subsp. ruderalis]|uniref:Protein kinase domain-containing protein n=2 Tax=Marchantia polymorpha TaxID=3197 RepID=A0AAF6BGE5_MARPO|nr:hypothetical protein MARPO_0095s0072 [Marchantia polymorpha]BBN11079.1 hypothetical protein Mp_5g08860 [Marchantia polymorpha subsp. ruderalis]|eukprot:PTQ32818.1 hypothetical protein MARPO_0095s0072 [Marchantia polymorpha]
METEFFIEYDEANWYQIQEVIGKGSYGMVCSAIDTHTGEKVAIKKINNIFQHVSDATRILWEIKLLRLLRHPKLVEVKHIMVPLSCREFKDIYVMFELMKSDLHQVVKTNDGLTREHYQFLKICDFDLAHVAFNDAPTTIFWTDFVATRWYQTPELCGIGYIFVDVLTGRPFFPRKNVVHQLDLMTNMLGSTSSEAIQWARNEKAKRYLTKMRKKQSLPFSYSLDLRFCPKDRHTVEQAPADSYIKGFANVEQETSAKSITKMEFGFERRQINKDDVRELIYREEQEET